jgi:hypothetical protein
MKAVDTIFPKCTPLLCWYHIQTNFKANFLKKATLEKKVRRSKVWTKVKPAWENIVECASEEEYNSSLNTFKERCGQWPKFVKYGDNTMLGPVKEKFIRV